MKRYQRYRRIDTKGCTGYLSGDVPLYPTVRNALAADALAADALAADALAADALAADDLPAVGEADDKHFPVAEVVSMTFSAQDRDTIATALLFVNAPASLRRRFGV